MLIQLFRMLYIVIRCANHVVRQAFSNRNYYNNITISPLGPFQCPVGIWAQLRPQKQGLGLASNQDADR